jgi:hypothetical protein
MQAANAADRTSARKALITHSLALRSAIARI